MNPILYVIVGVALGFADRLARPRPATAASRWIRGVENELRQQLTQRDAELGQLRTQLADTANARTAAEARQAAAEKVAAEQARLHEQSLREAKTGAGQSAGWTCGKPSKP